VKDFLLEGRAIDKVIERPGKETDKQQKNKEISFFFETQLHACLYLSAFFFSFGNQYMKLDNMNLRKYMPSSDCIATKTTRELGFVYPQGRGLFLLHSLLILVTSDYPIFIKSGTNAHGVEYFSVCHKFTKATDVSSIDVRGSGNYVREVLFNFQFRGVKFH
jgi:hypothetical protein